MKEFRLLGIDKFKELKRQGLTILDVRSPDQFAEGLVPGSVNIARNESFGKLVRQLLFEDQALLVVAEAGTEKTLHNELEVLGFDEILGYLKGGFEAWRDAGENIDVVVAVEVEELLIDLKFSQPVVIDLRPGADFKSEHLDKSKNVSMQELLSEVDDYASNKTYYVFSQPPSEAMTAISYLKLEGKHNFYYLTEGFAGLKKARAEMVIPQKKDKDQQQN